MHLLPACCLPVLVTLPPTPLHLPSPLVHPMVIWPFLITQPSLDLPRITLPPPSLPPPTSLPPKARRRCCRQLCGPRGGGSVTLWPLLESGIYLSPPGTPKNVQHEEVLIEERHVFSLSRKPAKASFREQEKQKGEDAVSSVACLPRSLPTHRTHFFICSCECDKAETWLYVSHKTFLFLFSFSSVAVVYCKALQCLLFTIAPIFACIHCSLPHHLVFVSQF